MVSHLVTREIRVYKGYYIRYQVTFYLWQIKLARKHTEKERSHVTGRLKIFHWHFRFLNMIQIPGTSTILSKHRKTYPKLPTN